MALLKLSYSPEPKNAFTSEEDSQDTMPALDHYRFSFDDPDFLQLIIIQRISFLLSENKSYDSLEVDLSLQDPKDCISTIDLCKSLTAVPHLTKMNFKLPPDIFLDILKYSLVFQEPYHYEIVYHEQDSLEFSIDVNSFNCFQLSISFLDSLRVLYKQKLGSLQLDFLTDEQLQLHPQQKECLFDFLSEIQEVTQLLLNYKTSFLSVDFLLRLLQKQQIRTLKVFFQNKSQETTLQLIKLLEENFSTETLEKTLDDFTFNNVLHIDHKKSIVQLKFMDLEDFHNQELLHMYQLLSFKRTQYKSLYLISLKPIELLLETLVKGQLFSEIYIELLEEIDDELDLIIADFLKKQSLLHIFILNGSVRSAAQTFQSLSQYSQQNQQDIKITNITQFKAETLEQLFTLGEALHKYDFSFYENQIQIQKNQCYELIIQISDFDQINQIGALAFEVFKCLQKTKLQISVSCDLYIFYHINNLLEANNIDIYIHSQSLIFDLLLFKQEEFHNFPRVESFRIHSKTIQYYTNVYKQSIIMIENDHQLHIDLRKAQNFKKERIFQEFLASNIPKQVSYVYAFIPQSDGFDDFLPTGYKHYGYTQQKKTTVREFQMSLVSHQKMLKFETNRNREKTIFDQLLQSKNEAKLAITAFKKVFQQGRTKLRKEICWELFQDILFDEDKYQQHELMPRKDCAMSIKNLFN